MSTTISNPPSGKNARESDPLISYDRALEIVNSFITMNESGGIRSPNISRLDSALTHHPDLFSDRLLYCLAKIQTSQTLTADNRDGIFLLLGKINPHDKPEMAVYALSFLIDQIRYPNTTRLSDEQIFQGQICALTAINNIFSHPDTRGFPAHLLFPESVRHSFDLLKKMTTDFSIQPELIKKIQETLTRIEEAQPENLDKKPGGLFQKLSGMAQRALSALTPKKEPHTYLPYKKDRRGL